MSTPTTTTTTTTTLRLPPPPIVNLDDDDDIFLLPSPPPTVSRRNKRSPRIINGTTVNNPIFLDHQNVAFINLPSSKASSSSSYHKRTKKGISPITIDLSNDENDDVQFIRSVKKDNSPGPTTFTCEICVDLKPYTSLFSIMGGCTHFYCSDCIVKYIASKLQDNITQIRCPFPGCPGLIEHDQCRSLLPKEVFDRWGDALCEAVLLAHLKYYCPFKDCSAPLLMDSDEEENMITESECPNCRRMFCVKCKVSWHTGINCEEFQKLNKNEREEEDIMLVQLAKTNKWIRCTKCRFYVEKSEGCLFMKCRCGYTFCYSCGAPLKEHYCRMCKR